MIHSLGFPSFSRLFLLMALALFNNTKTNGQYFERVYGNDFNTNGVFFARTPDRGVIILGNKIDTVYHSSGYYILKTDSDGSELWDENLNDPFNAYGNSITTLIDGKIVFLGTHQGLSYQNVAEVEVLDDSGNYLNSAVYPPFNGWGTSGVALTNSGDSSVSLTLYNDGFISNNYYSIFSLFPDLSTKWNDFVSFDGSFTNDHGISSASSDNVYTIAYYDNYFYSVNQLFRVTSLRKHNALGAVLLDSVYEFNCITTAISSTNDGGAIICGIQDSSLQKDMVLIRLDSTGNVLWQKQYGSTLDEEANSVIETSDGGFALLSTVADSLLNGQHDLLLLKTDANGDSLWSGKFGGFMNELALHIEKDSSDLILMGSTTSFDKDQIYLVKTDSSGIIQSPFNIVSPGKYFCETDTVLLQLAPSPNHDQHVIWSNGDTLSSSRVFASGNYFATITDSSGNSFQTPYFSIFFADLPQSMIGPDTTSLCSSTVLANIVTSQLINSYQWFYNGSIIPGEVTPYFSPQQPGLYSLVVSNYCWSDTSSSYVDTLFQLPVQPVITSPPAGNVCPGDSLPLSIVPTSNDSYQWYTMDDINSFIIPGATDSIFYVHEDGEFFIEASNINGCSVNSQPYPVTYDLNQEFVNPAGPASFCEGGEVDLSVSQGTNFLWSNGDTTQIITVDSSGQYYVSFINVNGCPKSSDTINITVFPNPVISLGPDTNLCNGGTLLLDAGPGYNNYFWNDGSSAQMNLALSNGPYPDTADYYVFVTDTNGCGDGDTLRIIFDICNSISGVNTIPFLLFPNPVYSGESIQVNGPVNQDMTIIVSDVMNRELINRQFSGNTWITETNRLPAGIYLYQIYGCKNSCYSGKLIIQ